MSETQAEYNLGNVNKSMKVKFKKLNAKAVTPIFGSEHAACFDLVAVSKTDERNYIEYDTGLAFEIPVGYVGLIYPRSSISNLESGFYLKNSVGIVDADYRGSVKFRFSYPDSIWNLEDATYKIGDRVGQMMIIPLPKIELIESNELLETARDAGGFGSTGR